LGDTDKGILTGMYEGLNRREIGQAVGLSHTTVNNHIPAIAAAVRAHL
jgi:DNA-binding NarL/FixJ family response regulator